MRLKESSPSADEKLRTAKHVIDFAKSQNNADVAEMVMEIARVLSISEGDLLDEDDLIKELKDTHDISLKSKDDEIAQLKAKLKASEDATKNAEEEAVAVSVRDDEIAQLKAKLKASEDATKNAEEKAVAVSVRLEDDISLKRTQIEHAEEEIDKIYDRMDWLEYQNKSLAGEKRDLLQNSNLLQHNNAVLLDENNSLRQGNAALRRSVAQSTAASRGKLNRE